MGFLKSLHLQLSPPYDHTTCSPQCQYSTNVRSARYCAGLPLAIVDTTQDTASFYSYAFNSRPRENRASNDSPRLLMQEPPRLQCRMRMCEEKILHHRARNPTENPTAFFITVVLPSCENFLLRSQPACNIVGQHTHVLRFRQVHDMYCRYKKLPSPWYTA